MSNNNDVDNFIKMLPFIILAMVGIFLLFMLVIILGAIAAFIICLAVYGLIISNWQYRLFGLGGAMIGFVALSPLVAFVIQDIIRTNEMFPLWLLQTFWYLGVFAMPALGCIIVFAIIDRINARKGLMKLEHYHYNFCLDLGFIDPPTVQEVPETPPEIIETKPTKPTPKPKPKKRADPRAAFDIPRQK